MDQFHVTCMSESRERVHTVARSTADCCWVQGKLSANGGSTTFRSSILDEHTNNSALQQPLLHWQFASFESIHVPSVAPLQSIETRSGREPASCAPSQRQWQPQPSLLDAHPEYFYKPVLAHYTQGLLLRDSTTLYCELTVLRIMDHH